MKTINVKGVGNLKVEMDTTVIKCNYKGNRKDYSDALKLASDVTIKLRKVLNDLGIDNKQISNTYFNINPNNVSYKDAKGNYYYKQEGFNCNQSYKIEFPINNDLLGKLLYAIANKTDLDPRIDVSFTLKDTENAKNILLDKAIKDSLLKANIIANSANVKLGEIINISYNWEDIFIRNRNEYTFDSCMKETCCCDSSLDYYDIDLSPNEMNLNDSIEVTYEIL